MDNDERYEPVLQAALHSTLIGRGFEHMSSGNYVLEQSDRALIFEVAMMRGGPASFSASAAIYFPDLDSIIHRVAPEFWIQTAGTSNRAHIATSIPRLVTQAKERYESSDGIGGLLGNWIGRFGKSNSGEQPKDRHYDGAWLLPEIRGSSPPNEPASGGSPGSAIEELGHHIDKLWKEHVARWYQDCEDPKFLIDWMVKQEVNGYGKEIVLGVLCHLVGNEKLAAFCLTRPIIAANENDELFNEYLTELHVPSSNRHTTIMGTRPWSEREVEYWARQHTWPVAEHAGIAEAIADHLGIRLLRRSPVPQSAYRT